ncbi:MAG: ATP-binding cassette domain-containing protein [Eubacterium sp.]|nr:ATP-binding cassette domain-containing protein [Eubacterium sp.]
MIKLENISKKFGNHIIFENYNMEVQAGEYVSICGVSGKGKTTLLNMIGMLDKPDSGDIYVKGIKNPRFDFQKGRSLLRDSITYIFQDYGLIEDTTVEYNLEIRGHFSKRNSLKDMIGALEKTGLDETFVNKKVYELSGGEQQRVALAGLFLKDFDIILADEPTGSLDKNNRDRILDLFDFFNKDGKTIIVVTHDDEVKKRAGRVIEL